MARVIVTRSATKAADITTIGDSLPSEEVSKRDSADELDPPASSNKQPSRNTAGLGRLTSSLSVWFEKLFEKRAGREEPLEDDQGDIRDIVVDGTMEDFERLLTVMEDAIEFADKTPPFITLASSFRAASKFKFHKFNTCARVTTTLVPHPVPAVDLGGEWDLPEILKRPFYEILRTPPAEPNDDGGQTKRANRSWMGGSRSALERRRNGLQRRVLFSHGTER
ncbi:hypothetical protein K438DRAFT_2083097 [Mycena galopus ATCC 62051]|nr:hypothetical protein K438DRAFT_2083097 [Mycena galopus ATCC 62051]